MIRLWFFILSAAFLIAPTGAEARKVALVIGNGNYANTSRLANPPNDIKLVAASAKQAGFRVSPGLRSNWGWIIDVNAGSSSWIADKDRGVEPGAKPSIADCAKYRMARVLPGARLHMAMTPLPVRG